MACFIFMVMVKSIILFFLAATFLSCQKEAATEIQSPAQSFLNVSYGGDPSQKMDIYLPEGHTDTTKILILIHGGAWTGGDKSEMTPYIPEFQQRFPGYAIVNTNYRLASAFNNYFPTQENDMKAVVDFLITNKTEYGISQKFVLLGASAGAHMALLQAYKYNSPSIKAVVDFFGPADMADLYNNITDPTIKMSFQILMGGTPAGNPSMYQQSSPLNFVSAQSPPTIILHGADDYLVPVSQSVSLKNNLDALGVPNKLIVFPGMGHEAWPAATMDHAFNQIEDFIKANE